MIGLDTNVIVRLVIIDDPAQTNLVKRYLEAHCSPQQPGFIGFVVLAEMMWVMGSLYEYGRAEIERAVLQLLDNPNLVFENSGMVRSILNGFVNGNVDFADMLIAEINHVEGCDTTATFDRKAAKLDGFTLIR
jgi:predicted nucleic-acid-binding protein